MASTSTPSVLGLLRRSGLVAFRYCPGLVIAGIVQMAVDRLSQPELYLLMARVVVMATVPLISQVLTEGLLWLLAGALFYTVAVIFSPSRRGCVTVILLGICLLSSVLNTINSQCSGMLPDIVGKPDGLRSCFISGPFLPMLSGIIDNATVFGILWSVK